MATNEISSTLRRSASGVKQENSASSSIPCVVHAGDLNDGVAPRYFCGVYAIIYMSRTISNANRIFLICPFYKYIILEILAGKNNRIASFFLGDEHLARIRSNSCISDKRHLGEKDVEVIEEEEKLDHRMAVLEEVTALEKKKSINLLYWYNCMCCLYCFLCMQCLRNEF
ncbi:hypothetical protein Ahy_A08g038733 [Arachis hypogaea]|uniref:Uncharacterized protein n=1 Tax=Arachis hypogaea TaxID=3818 RepID=A0A445BUJ2_ARAHY|nr:hypothetical protein Ahy_A08g038733 [Arachis hypogaea]